MNRIISIIFAYILFLFVFCTACEQPMQEEVVAGDVELKAGFNKFYSDIELVIEQEDVKRTQSKLELINNNSELNSNSNDISASDIDLIVMMVRAEAGNQPLEGKRAVADVILNRVDSDQFPDTVEGVVYQDKQFSCVKNGGLHKAAYTTDETDYEAVMLELSNRTDSEIIYFQTDSYSIYGTPAYIIGDHYFAKK